ncbi:hypothetical protein [Novosphingobium soli]|uniref:DUF697 domain-containing protein n=1 Tax=Novosphingobium soli TaxID=574956 RepID=A0ABV6CUX9_9SPHN
MRKRAISTSAIKQQARKAAGVVAAPTKSLKALADNGGELHGPSPNPATNLVIADIALRTGTTIARRAVERAVLGASYSPRKAKSILKGRTITETLLHGALARVAIGSVPGAIAVGGALIAKTLYDRSRARTARAEGAKDLHEMAKDGAQDA